MVEEARDADVQAKVQMLLAAQYEMAGRQLVLEEAFLAVAGDLLRGTPNPAAAFDVYATSLKAQIGRNPALQAASLMSAELAFHVDKRLDALMLALRAQVPGAELQKPTN